MEYHSKKRRLQMIFQHTPCSKFMKISMEKNPLKRKNPADFPTYSPHKFGKISMVKAQKIQT
jgi:hypothetical protein